jgi:alpha-D-ribose 1-methylphosphonate 5-triphosphate synthase subunit PhnH
VKVISAVQVTPAVEEGGVVRRHRVFRAALEALAHPGRWYTPLPARTGRDGSDQLASLLVESMCDPRSPLFIAGGELQLSWEPVRARREDAGTLVVFGPLPAETLMAARRGSELAPEDGATIVSAAPADVSKPVRLRGPGIDGECDALLPLDPEALRARDIACAAYPLGIDLLFVSPERGISGLPRTTRVEVLA